MKEPYRIRTAIAPHPVSRDEVKAYFDELERRWAVNPSIENSRIKKR